MIYILIGIIIVLIAIITYQSRHLLIQKHIIEAVNTMKDIIYWCDLNPNISYRYLSKSVDIQLGNGTRDKHLKYPDTIFETIHPEDRHLMEGKLLGTIDYRQPIVFRIQHTNGAYYWFEEVSTPIFKKGKLVGLVGVYRRIDDRMKKLKEIEFELSYDKLTKVYNRSYFEKIMAYYNNHHVKLGMAIVNLDNLKLVNDRLGHRSGDEFISTTAKILKNNANESISVCRIGVDEFAVLFEQATVEMVEQYFEAVNKELSKYQQNVFSTNLQFSVGYAFCESSFDAMEQLYEEADRNMYENKRSKEILVEFHI